MNSQIENTISRIADDARVRYDALLHNARQSTKQAAGTISRGKKPLKTISKLGLKLTAVTHRTADKVLRQNTKLLEHQIDAIARGLKEAAGADGLRDLLGRPVRMIPDNASLMASDAREALRIVASAGGEVRQILRGTADELRGATAAKASRKPAATAQAPENTGDAASGEAAPPT